MLRNYRQRDRLIVLLSFSVDNDVFDLRHYLKSLIFIKRITEHQNRKGGTI